MLFGQCSHFAPALIPQAFSSESRLITLLSLASCCTDVLILLSSLSFSRLQHGLQAASKAGSSYRCWHAGLSVLSSYAVGCHFLSANTSTQNAPRIKVTQEPTKPPTRMDRPTASKQKSAHRVTAGKQGRMDDKSNHGRTGNVHGQASKLTVHMQSQ